MICRKVVLHLNAVLATIYTIGEAMAAVDYGTEHLLKVILPEHEQMVHHLEHFLSPESLG